ncbi:MAG TPA: hotdog fold thioesterase [Myxococcota bacterium]|nr:hotdog fold thioesterase [Myxococcota bacterium]
MDAARRWLEKSPYAQTLGVQLEALTPSSARLVLPYREDNTNPGRALHGGVAASLVALGAQSLARAALGDSAGPWHTCALQVSYLAAAIGEAVEAHATLLRKGKELCVIEVELETPDRKQIAHGTATVRGRFGAPEPNVPPVIGEDAPGDPGPLGPHIARTPFMGRLGIHVEHMRNAQSRILLPLAEHNTDEGRGVHEGAVLALLDTTGAMAAWALTGPGRFKASTPSMQAQILVPPPRADLVAYGNVVHRDRELFWCDVEVGSAPDRRLIARGTVVYRIVGADASGS